LHDLRTLSSFSILPHNPPLGLKLFVVVELARPATRRLEGPRTPFARGIAIPEQRRGPGDK